MCVCVCVCACACMPVCMYACAHVRRCVYTGACVCVHKCAKFGSKLCSVASVFQTCVLCSRPNSFVLCQHSYLLIDFLVLRLVPCHSIIFNHLLWCCLAVISPLCYRPLPITRVWPEPCIYTEYGRVFGDFTARK